VPRGEIVPLLEKVFAAFKLDRNGGESFGDYCARVGIESLKSLVQG
jgi:sulfite reductase beta subunit-like hemoprotein